MYGDAAFETVVSKFSETGMPILICCAHHSSQESSCSSSSLHDLSIYLKGLLYLCSRIGKFISAVAFLVVKDPERQVLFRLFRTAQKRADYTVARIRWGGVVMPT